MPTRTLRISNAGLRGIVGSGVTAGRVLDFAAAFATFLDSAGPVVIGRDPRRSGVMLREGVTASLLASGRDVIDLDVASTPVVQHAIRSLDAAGGVSIGASHNGAEWNALKFFGRRGTYLSTAEASELLDIYHLRHFHFVEWDKIGKRRASGAELDSYLDELATVFDFERLRKFRVVVDCANGTSSLILKRLNERFGFQFILINATMDGTFAHEPSTSARVVEQQLSPLVIPLQADAGFLFDADSDRVALAAEDGAAISEEMILALCADQLLTRSPGKILITNVCTTRLLEDIAARTSSRVVRVPVGRAAAIDALSAYPADQIALAGEGTGAVMMPQFRFVYDGIATMFTLLEMRADRGTPFSEIIAGYPRYTMLKAEIELARQRIPEMLSVLEGRFAEAIPSTLDGLRLDWPDRWFNVRVSQTEALVRVIVEQRGDAPQALFDEVQEIVETYA